MHIKNRSAETILHIQMYIMIPRTITQLLKLPTVSQCYFQSVHWFKLNRHNFTTFIDGEIHHFALCNIC